ncbi:MAG: hypothetical protein L3J16_03555, partial [Anaerolineales bacterium]|nr:hypothetical protein [Anaerolineales bacterium]
MMIPIPSEIKALILDMDGVLWRAHEPIGDLAAIFAAIRARGFKVVLATNNSTRGPADYLAKLAKFGVTLNAAQVLNSSLAAAALLKEKFPAGGEVYVIGERGLLNALRAQGFTPVTANRQPDAPIAVVAGMDMGITYAKLTQATLLIRAGAPFYATNPDKTFPTPRGQVPGAGALQAALTAASGAEPIIAGKPQPYL